MKILSGIFKSMTPSRPEPARTVVPAVPKTNPAVQRNNPWHAVSIVSKAPCCQAARRLRAVRMLSRTAPRLPLADCEFGGRCNCAYKHHSDRRAQPRRKEELTGLRPNVKIAVERRVTPSRRRAEDMSGIDVSTIEVSSR